MHGGKRIPGNGLRGGSMSPLEMERAGAKPGGSGETWVGSELIEMKDVCSGAEGFWANTRWGTVF